MFKVAIVGKPNVGKSTLFNKLVKRKTSITLNQSGVTRDSIEEEIIFQNKKFILCDTAGFDPKSNTTIDRNQYTLKKCNLILFMIENKISNDDYFFARWIRKNVSNAEILLICNKNDCKNQDNYYELGFDKHFSISAEHSIGIKDLLCYIHSKIETDPNTDIEENKNNIDNEIRIAILGKPNVGKSTFANKILNDNRSLVCDESGTTRDPVSTKYVQNEVNFNLIDTAGLRKKCNVTDIIEGSANSKSMQVAKTSDVVIFIFDISNFTLEKQDYIIINKILDAGKPVILVGNKKDKVESPDRILDFISLQSNKFLVDDMKIFSISSLNDDDFTQIIEECYKLFILSKREIATSMLNKWLGFVLTAHKHPMVKGKDIKFKYITKLKNKLTFFINCNHPDLVEKSYLQYLKNNLTKKFSIKGIPIRIILKKSDNPYKTT
jgi:GTP-binding protein